MALDTIVTGSKLTTLANAIRTKGGTSAQLTLDQMAQAVANIPSGGGFDWSQVKGGGFKGALVFLNQTATSLDLTGLDTSSFVSFYQMFSECRALTSIDVSTLDISHAVNMASMFSFCTSLTSLNLSSMDLSNVTDISNLCLSDTNLSHIDLPAHTENVTSFSQAFALCNFTSLDLSSLDTSSATSMYGLVRGNASLTSVNMASFKTGNVTDMRNMFQDCTNLTDIIWSQEPTVQPICEPPTAGTRNMGITSSMWFYVPDGLVSLYKSATNWSVIYQRIKPISELPAALKTLYGIS